MEHQTSAYVWSTCPLCFIHVCSLLKSPNPLLTPRCLHGTLGHLDGSRQGFAASNCCASHCEKPRPMGGWNWTWKICRISMISTYRNHIKDITYIFEWGIKMVMSPKSPINKVGFNHLQWCSMVCFFLFFFGYIQGNFLMCFFNHQIHGGKPNPFPIFPWNSMIYWPTIWLFNSLPWYRWPIETDGLPFT